MHPSSCSSFVTEENTLTILQNTTILLTRWQTLSSTWFTMSRDVNVTVTTLHLPLNISFWPCKLAMQRLRRGGEGVKKAHGPLPHSYHPTSVLLGCLCRGDISTPVYIYLMPSSKTPLVDGYVTMMAARSLLCFSTWWNKIAHKMVNFHTPRYLFRCYNKQVLFAYNLATKILRM